MTPEEQRIALVQACPTVFVRTRGQSGWNYRSSITERIMPCIDGNPLSDLNAMHEAEKTLFPVEVHQLWERDKWCDYQHNLDVLCVGHPGVKTRATAAQRAEAFLRTKGLWKE